MATDFKAKSPTPFSFIALAFRNGIEYRYGNVRLNSGNHASISCKKKFVNFGPEMQGRTC